MNGKVVKTLAATVAMLALSACGQEYTPAEERHPSEPHGPTDLFGSNNDFTIYGTISYSVLRSTLVDVLGVNPTGAADADENPLADPVGYLDANKELLGEPVYGDDPESSVAPGDMTSGGYKAWIFSAASACGMMVQTNPARLFPAGANDYTYAYSILLGRVPLQAEKDRLDALQAELYGSDNAPDLAPVDGVPDSDKIGTPVFATTAKKQAAVCTSILTSLEFIGET